MWKALPIYYFVLFYPCTWHVIHTLQFTSTSKPVVFHNRQESMNVSLLPWLIIHWLLIVPHHYTRGLFANQPTHPHGSIIYATKHFEAWTKSEILSKPLLGRMWESIEPLARRLLWSAFWGVWLSSTKLVGILSLGLGFVAPCPNSSIRKHENTTNYFKNWNLHCKLRSWHQIIPK